MILLSSPELIRALLSLKRVDSVILSDLDMCGLIEIFGNVDSLCLFDNILGTSQERASLTRIGRVRSGEYLPSLVQSHTDCSFIVIE